MSKELSVLPICKLDGVKMDHLWDGITESGAYMVWYICEACYSTSVRCSNTEDPTFRMILTIQQETAKYVETHK